MAIVGQTSDAGAVKEFFSNGNASVTILKGTEITNLYNVRGARKASELAEKILRDRGVEFTAQVRLHTDDETVFVADYEFQNGELRYFDASGDDYVV